MSTTPSPDRTFIIALTAAVASATLAVGVMAWALLGWVGPRTTPGESWGSRSALRRCWGAAVLLAGGHVVYGLDAPESRRPLLERNVRLQRDKEVLADRPSHPERSGPAPDGF
jgi:hypothetical protein